LAKLDDSKFLKNKSESKSPKVSDYLYCT
jgi:hypothetical protein